MRSARSLGICFLLVVIAASCSLEVKGSMFFHGTQVSLTLISLIAGMLPSSSMRRCQRLVSYPAEAATKVARTAGGLTVLEPRWALHSNASVGRFCCGPIFHLPMAHMSRFPPRRTACIHRWTSVDCRMCLMSLLPTSWVSDRPALSGRWPLFQ